MAESKTFLFDLLLPSGLRVSFGEDLHAYILLKMIHIHSWIHTKSPPCTFSIENALDPPTIPQNLTNGTLLNRKCAESGPAHEELSAYAASVIFLFVLTRLCMVCQWVWFAEKDLIRWRDFVRPKWSNLQWREGKEEWGSVEETRGCLKNRGTPLTHILL